MIYFEFISVHGAREESTSIICMRALSGPSTFLPHWIVSASLLSISWLQMWGFISGRFILFPWSIRPHALPVLFKAIWPPPAWLCHSPAVCLWASSSQKSSSGQFLQFSHYEKFTLGLVSAPRGKETTAHWGVADCAHSMWPGQNPGSLQTCLQRPHSWARFSGLPTQYSSLEKGAHSQNR